LWGNDLPIKPIISFPAPKPSEKEKKLASVKDKYDNYKT